MPRVCIALDSIPIAFSGNIIAFGIHTAACNALPFLWTNLLLDCIVGLNSSRQAGVAFRMDMAIDARFGVCSSLACAANPKPFPYTLAPVTLTNKANFTVEATGSAAATNIVMAKAALETARSGGATFMATAILAGFQEAIDRPSMKPLLGNFSAALVAAVAAATVNVTVGEIVGNCGAVHGTRGPLKGENSPPVLSRDRHATLLLRFVVLGSGLLMLRAIGIGSFNRLPRFVG